jgi:transposase-like protein
MKDIVIDFPTNELDFDRKFSTEQACETYLFSHKWPKGFVCSKCGHEHYWKSNRKLYICQKCEHQHSLTNETIMENTQKDLRIWFKAMWLYTTRKSGLSAKDLQRLLGLSYYTAWSWMQKMRKGSVRPEREKLGGTVEVDEFYYGGFQEGKPGRGSENKTSVAIAVEKNENGTTGRVRFQVIEDCSSKSLEEFIERNIEKQSTIISDGWSGYNGLNKKDYKHQPDKDCDLEAVHRVISLFKRLMLGTYHGRPDHKYLPQYLEEFAFRFNRKKSKFVGKIFDRIVTLSTVAGYYTVKQLVEMYAGDN